MTDYSYDRLYRLVSETITDPVNGNYNAQYSYDKVGNRTYSTIDGVQTAYTYDNNDRLTQQGGTTYSHDDNGNTTSETLDGNTDSYSYNVKNELTGSSKGNSTYAYDIDSIRIQKRQEGALTDYLVDHNRDYAQVIGERDEVSQISYLYGDDLIKRTRNGTQVYYLYDGLGSTRALTDSAGALTDTYHYEAFGQLLNSTGPTENDYLFAGEQYDSYLDNYYLRARYYNLNSGRFTQMDSWMGNNQDPVTLHKYLYANVDPVNNIDPSGHFSIGSVMSAVNVVATLATRADAAYNLYSLATGDQELTARQIGFEILAGMGAGKLIKMFSKKFKTCKITNSFVEGTLVYTPSGLIPIEEIKIGDLVYSYDENTEGIVEQKVVHLIKGEKEREIITLGTRSGDIVQATDGHPFYVSENEEKWTKAGNLSIGNILLNSDGGSVPIVDIVSKISFEKVYNLSVENSHNYYVGQQKLLAHNSGCRIPHRAKPRIDQGNDREGWIHIQKRHISGGGSPGTQGDLFASGTTLAHIEQAAAKLVAKGKRLSDPNARIQRFEKKMTVNGKTANYRVIVDGDDGNRVITIFPVGGG